MRMKLSEAIFSLIITSIILVFLEIITATILPLTGVVGYRFAFNILIVLFLSLRVQTPFIPYFILFTQYLHSLFSIEGWALGTFIGIVISGVVGYVKDKLEFGTYITTVIVVQIFQVVWFILASFLICLKIGDFGKVIQYFTEFLPESVILSLLAPFLFKVLERIWRLNDNAEGVSL